MLWFKNTITVGLQTIAGQRQTPFEKQYCSMKRHTETS